MPARSWADAPRLEFLKGSLSGYEFAQSSRQTRKFLAKLFEKYFAQFPPANEDLLTLEKKRIATWMNNHSGGRNKQNGTLLRATRNTFRELLRGKLDEKRRQRLQATQAYSELYWVSKLKDIVVKEWNQKREDEPELSNKHYIAFMNMRVRQLYEAETDDVKVEVEHYRSAQADESEKSPYLLPGEEELDEDEQRHRIAAREAQAAIDNIDAILSEIAKEIEDIAGLKSHFLVSGPEPKRNGNMVMFTITSGRTVSGNRTFKDHYTYKTEVQDKFLAFAKGCYTREERIKYEDVPFPRTKESHVGCSTADRPIPTTKPTPNAASKPPVRKDARKAVSPTSDTSVDSNSDHDDDSGQSEPISTKLDAAEHTIDNDDEYDEMDIFSPLLPPERRIIDSKESGGLTLHKTAEGQWLSEAELHRMANMARNSRLMKALGVDEAKRQLTSKVGGQSTTSSGSVLTEDDREFSVTRSQSTLVPRECHPRQSKKNVTYVEKKDDGCSDHEVESIPVPVAARTLCDASEPVVAGDEPQPTDNVMKPASSCDVVNTSVLDSQAIAASIQDPPTHSPSVLPANLVSPGASLTNDVPMQDADDCMTTDEHNGSTMAMDIDNHASLDDAPPVLSGSVVLQESQGPVDLDTLDFSSVPSWLQRPLTKLRKEFRGELEDKLLTAYVALELAWQPFDKHIGTTGRPQAVTWWIKNARPIDRIPPCIDLASFPAQVRGWWSTIQPQWRVPVLDDWPLTKDIPAGEAWQEVRLGGCNGLFLILLCLSWWRKSAEEEFDRVALAEYISVAEDVVFVFEAILRSGVSQSSTFPLIGSTRANARPSSNRTALLQSPEGRISRSTTLRSSGVKENVRASRAQRSRA